MAPVLAIWLLLLQAPGPSGRSPFKVQGTVTDESGAVIPGVTVQVKAAGDEFPMVFGLTDDTGRYTVSGVLSGRNRLVATLPGFATTRRTLDLDSSVTINLVLRFPLFSPTGVTAYVDPATTERRLTAERLVDQLWQYSRTDSLSQSMIVKELHALGTDAVPALILALQDPDVPVRRNAAVVLFDLSSGSRPRVDIREALPALNSALQDSDAAVRALAAQAIESMAKR